MTVFTQRGLKVTQIQTALFVVQSELNISFRFNWSEVSFHPKSHLNQAEEEESDLTQSQLSGANLPLPIRKDPLYQAPWVPQSCGLSFH